MMMMMEEIGLGSVKFSKKMSSSLC
jgi:hypothetical protein